MFADRKKLWEAYPYCVGEKGVSTVGGWLCVRVTPDAPRPTSWWFRDEDDAYIAVNSGGTFWLSGGDEEECARDVVKEGDLLPAVDPSDTATWSCLLAHLAKLMGYEDEGYGFAWWRNGTMVFKEGAWILDNGPGVCGEFEIDCADPAEALVLATIQAREANSE